MENGDKNDENISDLEEETETETNQTRSATTLELL
jgi:hypothetical protein